MKKNYNLEYFLSKTWSFVLMKNGEILYKSEKQGLQPLIFCVKNHKREMRGAIVFDKIVGQAAAMLLLYAKIREVWTPTMSRDAKKYLVKYKIKIDYKKEVRHILNRKGDDLCPMEKLSLKIGVKFAENIIKG